MFSTRRSVDKILQIYKNEIKRHISKTTSVTNSDAMVPRLDQQVTTQQNEESGVQKKLLKLQKYHRSVNPVSICVTEAVSSLFTLVYLTVGAVCYVLTSVIPFNSDLKSTLCASNGTVHISSWLPC